MNNKRVNINSKHLLHNTGLPYAVKRAQYVKLLLSRPDVNINSHDATNGMALMTAAERIYHDSRVLAIQTGPGYQLARLSRINGLLHGMGIPM